MISENIIERAELQPGDVLVGSAVESGYEGETGYCHAAIYIGPEGVLNACGKGVGITSVEGAFKAYSNVAVLRLHEPWHPNTVNKLEAFSKSHLDKPFNRAGVVKIACEWDSMQEVAGDRIEAYFRGTDEGVPIDRERYFCSELVVSAFIYCGIISESAALVYKPEAYGPDEIIIDKTFGYFVGYVERGPVDPDADWFSSNI